MSRSFVQLNIASSEGQKMDAEELASGRMRQTVQLGGAADAEYVAVTNSAPSGSAYGLVTRGFVGGDVASGAADGTTNPVKIGGRIIEDLDAAQEDIDDRFHLPMDRRGVLYTMPRAPRAKGMFLFSKSTPTPGMDAGLGTDAEIFQMRWGAGSYVGHIRRIVMTHFTASTAFSAGYFQFKLRQVTDWTANGTGGSGITQADVCLLDAGGSNASPIGSDVSGFDLRMASTVALGAGTKVISDGPLAQIVGWAPAVAGDLIARNTVFYDSLASVEPLILREDTGLAIQAIVPATGVWRWGISVEFAAGYPAYGYGQSA